MKFFQFGSAAARRRFSLPESAPADAGGCALPARRSLDEAGRYALCGLLIPGWGQLCFAQPVSALFFLVFAWSAWLYVHWVFALCIHIASFLHCIALRDLLLISDRLSETCNLSSVICDPKEPHVR